MYRVIFLNKGRWIRAYDEMGNDVFRYINKKLTWINEIPLRFYGVFFDFRGNNGVFQVRIHKTFIPRLKIGRKVLTDKSIK